MNDKSELEDILFYINNKLKIKHLPIKEFTSILYLIDWNYCWNHNYRFFNYNWTNMIYENIKLVESDIKKSNIETLLNNKNYKLKTPLVGKKLYNLLRISIDNVLNDIDIINKSTYYFHNTLTFELFYNIDKNKINILDFENLVKSKKNKEY